MADATLHMNLKQVLEKIDQKQDLTLTQKRDLISAINTLAKWLQLPLDKIVADRRDIRTGFNRLNHSQLGVTKKRFDNVRSLVDKALEHGMIGSFNAVAEPVSDEWQKVLALVPEGWQRFKMKQLARYSSHECIVPSQICAATFVSWAAWREENAPLAKHPSRIVNDVWTLWNRCAVQIPDWPYGPIPKPSKQKSVLIPLSAFHQSLQDELATFEEASLAGTLKCRTRNPKNETGLETDRKSRRRRRGKQGVTPKVAQNRVIAIRQCAQAIIDKEGVAPEALKSISDIVTPDNADAMADAVIERTGKVTEYPHSLVKDLRAVAVQWLNADEHEIAEYNEILSCLAEEAGLGGLTAENRKRLLPFQNPQNVARLVSLPGLIFDELEAERKKHGRVTILMACRARTAIGISLLTMLPVRRANLAAIEIGKHLVLPATKNDRAYLSFEPAEVKNGRGIGCTIPQAKQELIDLYVKFYRPAIIGKQVEDCPYLFPTQTGKPIAGGALGNDVVALIGKETGLKVNLHLFRHLMAAIILRERPGQYDSVRALLGHSKDSRVTALYAEIESEVAARILTEATEAEIHRPKRKKPAQRKWRRS